MRGAKVNGTSWTFWWNDERQTCASISTEEGRYASVEQVPAANCQAPASNRHAESADHASQTLTLTCYGEGQHLTSQSHVSSGYNAQEKKPESSVRMETGQEQFRTTVMLEAGAQGGRIKLEGKMVLPLHSDAVDGWWTLTDYHADDNVISGKYDMNFASKPTVHVDRHSGVLTIKGTQSFSGKCEKYDGGRKF